MKLLFILLMTAFAAKPAPESKLWPREIELDSKQKVLVYQPQIESITDNQVTAQAAFKVSQNKKDIYGSFTIRTDALIAKDQDIVTLSHARIEKVEIPAKDFNKEDFKGNLQKAVQDKQMQIPYQALVNNLAILQGESERAAVDLKNDPPMIIYSKVPSLLIMISGEPQWAAVEGSGLERIVNTSALFLRDKKSNIYYLWALERWFSADQVMGPYKVSKSEPSSKFVMTKDDLIKVKKIDPITGKDSKGSSIYPPGVVPAILVTNKPTELLQSQGEPQFKAVQNTGLLYMENSPNSIFLETKSQRYFVVISGRWFESASLNGPWNFISGKNLPADFKKIPTNSPVADILVSVPGTPQAKEGLIASTIPQTAKVPKDLQPEKIVIDGGSPKWVEIPGTGLRYAENANTPLIMVNDKQFYAVQNAVWFNAGSFNGPWSVAIAVPSDIYKIPSSSPLYYVTYVRIYKVTEDSVIVGYTPGYQGTYVSADGTIVYGTGYVYPAYTSGEVWYPPPSTYGYGAGYGWGAETGFYMGFSMGYMMYPWGWGGCCWGPAYVNIHVKNVYHNWGTRTVITGNGGHGLTVNSIGDQKFVRAHYDKNIYTAKDGEIYRRTGKGDWQRQVGPGSWEEVNLKSNASAQNLEAMHTNRMQENKNFNNQSRQRTPSSQPAPQPRGGASGGYRGGGGRGGGGFRR